MNSIRNEFHWDGNSGKRKFHLVKWQMVMKDEEEGELGVRNLKLHNRSLLFIRLWRHSMEGTEASIELINAIHGKKSGWWIMEGHM